MITSTQVENFNHSNDLNHQHHQIEDHLTTSNSSEDRSKIVEFYRHRSILITGGSGFIGKVLIEKLLRTCPDIKHIFVLIRPKWNKKPQERVNELLRAPLFDSVRNGDDKGSNLLQEKIIVVEGDVTQQNLGLSDQNLLRIMNEVSVIYHSAATVKFDEPLKQSIAINIAGTKNMIDICRKIPQLAALVHVSTAYANCDKDEIDEHIYPVDNMDPENLIELASWLDQDTMQELKKRLLGNRPNTYTYTKALAEWLLIKCARDLPVVICRPSIVVASWQEPFEGWIDNVNGPTGIILGAGKGLIRSMYAESSYVADLIPVDTVINLIITLGWFANVYKNHKSSFHDTAESLTESTSSSSSIGTGLGSHLNSVFENDNNINDFSFDNNLIIRKGEGCELKRTSLINVSVSQHDNNGNNNNNNNNNMTNSEDIFQTTDGNNLYAHHLMETNGNNLEEDLYNIDENKHHYLNRQKSITTTIDDGYRSTSSFDTIKEIGEIENNSYEVTDDLNNKQATLCNNNNNNNNNDVVKQRNQRVLQFVAQRRMAQEKHAAFEYKLKQFRHNTQTKLIGKKLPEELADIPVFHCTSGDKKPITWGQIQIFIISICALYPSITTYRYPSGSFTNNKRLDNFYHITLHYIPGYMVDFIIKLFGGKPILVKIFKKFDQAANVLMAFTSKQWRFNTDNKTMLINELMSEEDKRLFNCDISSIDWAKYLTGYVLGVRKFMLKEPISNLEKARRNLKLVYYRNLSLQAIFFMSFIYYFFTSSSLINYFI